VFPYQKEALTPPPCLLPPNHYPNEGQVKQINYKLWMCGMVTLKAENISFKVVQQIQKKMEN